MTIDSIKTAFPAVMTRRSVIITSLAAPVLYACSSRYPAIDIDFTALEESSGARLGIAAMDMSSGAAVSHRGGEIFPYCSVYKWILGALILEAVDHGRESLDRVVTFQESDVVFYSPITESKTGRGGMSVRSLCEAALQHSDNTAANVLTNVLGGPAALTARIRQIGDDVTRFDRMEPELNRQDIGEVRDTTSPLAMMNLMKTFLFGKALKEPFKTLLQEWMIGSLTGKEALRAGFPEGWVIGDKTGKNSFRSNNNVAFAIPPKTLTPPFGPILITSFADVDEPLTPQSNAIHKHVAELVVSTFSQSANAR